MTSSDLLSQSLFENLPCPVLLLNNKGKVLYVSPEAQQYLGLHQSEAPINNSLPSKYLWITEEADALLCSEELQQELDKDLPGTNGTLPTRITFKKVFQSEDEPYIIVLLQPLATPHKLENHIEAMIQGVSTATGDAFFQSLVMHLVKALGADHAFIGEFSDNGKTHTTTVAFCVDGQLTENVTVPLANTACEHVLAYGLQCYPTKVRERFRFGTSYFKLGVESYYGILLNNSQGEPIGLMSVMGRKALPDGQLAISVLKVFAARAASELEYKYASEKIEDQLHFLQTLIDAIPNPIFFKDTQGRYMGCNEAYADTTRLSKPEVIGKTVQEVAPKGRARICHNEDLLVLEQKKVRSYEVKETVDDGPVRTLVLKKAPFFNRYGSLAGLVGIIHDVTEIKQAEEALRRSQDFADTVLDTMNDAVAIMDVINFRVLGANRVFIEEYGQGREDVRGCHCFELTNCDCFPNPDPHPNCCLHQSRVTEQYALTEHDLDLPDGSHKYVEVAASPIRDSLGRITKAVYVSRDVTDRKKAQDKIQQLAYYDALTGMPNRTMLMNRLRQILFQAQSNRQQAVVMFLDLDRFKGINDTMGHRTGDRLLRIIAERLKKLIRKQDIIARLGGDEFVIALSNLAHRQDIQTVAEKLLEAIQAPVHLDETTLFITGSIGIAMYPSDGQDGDCLLKNADMAMYKAKEEGRNTFKFFSMEMNRQAVERVSMENRLRQALHNNEFFLLYQPQVDLETGTVTGMEALIRWQQPSGIRVSPGKFIPLAEESDLIFSIGEWVLRQACIQARRWLDGNFQLSRIAVNLSGRQLHQPDLPERIAAILRETGLPAQNLELELTESILMDNPNRARETLSKLKEMGVQIAIDDFGTGYSSLSYLKNFPADRLKIDRSFVSDIPDDQGDAAIARAIIAMALSLNLKVIAEGVETEEQREFLWHNECGDMQGFLFSRPIPAEEASEILARQSLPYLVQYG